MLDRLPFFVWVLLGVLIGVGIMLTLSKMGLEKHRQEADLILKKANDDADSMRRQAAIDGKNQAYELKLAAEKELKEKRQEISEKENKLIRREDSLNFRDEKLTNKEKSLDDKLANVERRQQDLKAKEEQLQAKIDVQQAELERVASLSAEDAKKELMAIVEKRTENEVTAYIRDKEEEAKAKAADKARNIIALAIQRYSQEETIERTVSVVALPNDDMKGRIIGREGRNIRAIEQATGVDLIVDDTPEAITISCFDPIRREIARLTLESLIRDGRIQPGRIEEVVNKMTRELNEQIQKAGEDAVFRMGIGKIDRELVTLLGRLRYRYSYGQNVLEHSMEVASLAGIMAAELGLNQALAKRAGLLHDIGKAVDFEVEGSHVELGVKIARKHGENQIVINAIESHHGDTEPVHLISNLVAAADTLSAARPGARYESMENYISRLEELEKLADSFEGIEKSYAIQAGREIRVMAIPDQLDDLACERVAREIKEKIESNLNYPGQIKVTVIREVRKTEIAR
ncbi:MAG: ribonuclease Y [Erysipelotrichales bacterium]|nr:ribonuclease Y [Erysipelotrichales bacterium]MBQ1386634.1 ribonuclease Y [Erysipelotrichales bacterium]MBQ2310780.1 ribonuclease Y [Erysipelotrichales bacterium]MBQ4375607.1 ribonuclease Y [Erysipelotrichales bacterium]